MDLGADAGKDKDNLEGITWKTITVTLGELKPWADNPKTITKAAAKRLLASWKEYGQVQTIAVSPSLHVLDGHQRLNVLMAAYGMDYTVDARQSSRELTEDEQKRLVILLHAGAVGSWDWDSLSSWSAPDLMEWGMDSEALAGWKKDIAALGNLLESEKPTTDAEPQIDRAAELLEKWQVKPGDLWRIGEHRLLCGDSTKREDVERVMGGEKASLFVTDPPYGVSYADKNKFLNAISRANRIETPIENDHKTVPEMAELWLNVFSTVIDFCDDGCPYYIFSPQGGELMMMMMMMIQRSGFLLKHSIIWVKQQFVLGRSDYHYKHEPILYGWKDGGHKFYGGTGENSVWEVDKPNVSDLHPTMKPVEIYERAIRNSSQEAEIVADVFCGSGTALVACQNLSRRCRAIEISPAYCSVILERMNTAFPELEIELISNTGD